MKYINNNIKILEKKYASIIGESPSKGARSPKLWNKAYKNFKLKYKMYPMDVYEDNLEKLIIELRKDKKFIGGSVTAPYKEKIIKYLDGISTESKKIGSVNTLIKKNNKIYGENTDYHGVLYSLKNFSYKKKILILGGGGAGKAVILACSNFFKGKKILVYNRNKKNVSKILDKLKTRKKLSLVHNLNEIKKMSDIDLMINSTSIGFDSWVLKEKKFVNLKFFSPLVELKNIFRINKKNKEEFIKKNLKIIKKSIHETYNFLIKNKKLSVFDIIYNPDITQLLYQSKLCNMKIKNGLDMNLYQAVKAFRIVNKIKNEAKIFESMRNDG